MLPFNRPWCWLRCSSSSPWKLTHVSVRLQPEQQPRILLHRASLYSHREKSSWQTIAFPLHWKATTNKRNAMSDFEEDPALGCTLVHFHSLAALWGHIYYLTILFLISWLVYESRCVLSTFFILEFNFHYNWTIGYFSLSSVMNDLKQLLTHGRHSFTTY